MIKRIVLIGFIAICKALYGINPYVLKQNNIFYFFEEEKGCIYKINCYGRRIEALTIDKVPLFLCDVCWGREPTYIFCEDKNVYKGTSLQVKNLLAYSGQKTINIALQNKDNVYTITCLFPQWPGLDKVSKTAAYDDNRGIMLFPLIPKNPKWYSEIGKITIYTDFWKEFNNFIIGESYVEKTLLADKPGHLCIALPCLVNYFNDTLSFFCPMKNAGFSLNLQANTVRFSNQLYVDQEPKQCTFIMDIWPSDTQIKGISVQVFR